MKAPVEIEKRNVSKARRDKIIAGQGGVCKRAHCGAPATDVDHILPLWIGGTNRDDNLEGLCVDHHKAKTSLEARIRGKCNRIVARDSGTRRERQPIPQRVNAWPPKGSQKLRGGGWGLTKKALRLLARAEKDAGQ